MRVPIYNGYFREIDQSWLEKVDGQTSLTLYRWASNDVYGAFPCIVARFKFAIGRWLGENTQHKKQGSKTLSHTHGITALCRVMVLP
ncbi:hypothetical protein [Alkalimonas sp.]|uniref:hypothetical protein n=1 Tax=Alkalimonas sp. TaxID=1872453 RepID=UPI00263A7B8A|nr:hypothetical protein [Alkalimonas sp.]MCC5825841.1 hypothetical protein [Alkalimonas sp.]